MNKQFDGNNSEFNRITMTSNNKTRPPRWAERFLEWYCRRDLLEDLQGDLNEYFERHCKSIGPTRARLVYIIDVFKFLRIYTLRKPEFLNLLIHWIMIGSYIRTSGRSIVRNRLFSAINIVGLAISMSVGLLLLAFLSDLFSYDDLHGNKDRIYRVITEYQRNEGSPEKLASTSLKAGRLIKESATGIDDVVILRQGYYGDANAGDKTVPLQGLYAEQTFFDVFSFSMLSGDTRTALKEPYSIVLTESSAKKIFGDQEAIGESIKFYMDNDTSNYVVTGMIQDIPKFSHMQFEGLISYSTYEERQKNDENFMKWRNIWSDYVYLLLPEGADTRNIQAHLNRISAEQNKELERGKITLQLQPLKNIVLGPDLSNPIGTSMSVSIVYVVGGLAFIVILSACFNYTNLSIARSLRRSREVGIRKITGAMKSHVFGQFIVEAILISMLALLFSFGLFLFIKPQFLGIAPELGQIVSLDLSAKLILIFVSFAILVGILAGILPAIFFSRIDAVKVLKDASTLRVFRHVNMRKALIVVQYTFSLMFITATIIGYNQYRHALSFDLGFTTANILNVALQGNKPELLEKALNEFPEVDGIAKSMMITSVGTYYGGQMKYKDPRDSAKIFFNMVDENYLPLHDHQLIAGRNFTAKTGKSEDEVIVNEKVLKRFDVGDPAQALGQIVTVDDLQLQIVGVMKDFHYGKVDSEIPAVIFRYSNEEAGYLNVKITSSDWQATFARLEGAWKKIDPVHPLKATFYDEQIADAYSEFSAMIKIIGFLAFLAISIASLGLMGMVVFITETRLKEISIRKVLGATEASLIYILSRGFFFLLLISAGIALPLTYIFFANVLLPNIVYHAPIGFIEMFISVVVVMGIALLMIGSQTLKVARSNPAEVLKTE